jgi:DNA helicase-2/ATP-dependent DNA helicase PcrA
VLTNRYGIVNESIKFIRSRVNVSEALSELEWLQARALTPPAYAAAAAAAKRTTTAKPEDLEKVFSEYEKTKAKRGVVDLGDLLSRTTHDIANDFDYAEATRWRYRHLLVDEAQDMNPQQFAFFSALRGKNRDVFVVGDPLQSIYGWNGAEPSLFDTLPEKLGGAHIVHLVNNYRCSPVIVAAGLHVLTNNGIPATARSTKLDGEAITVQGYANEHDEANGIALLATQAHRSLARWSDIAVLVRTNTQREIVAGRQEKLAPYGCVRGVEHRESTARRAVVVRQPTLQRRCRSALQRRSRNLPGCAHAPGRRRIAPAIGCFRWTGERVAPKGV